MILVNSAATMLLHKAAWAAQRAVVEGRLTEDLVQDVEDALRLCKADGLAPELADVVQVMVDGLRRWVREDPRG